MNSKIYDLLRPFYKPVFKALRSRLVTEHTFVRHPEVAIPRPWDYVQFQVERNLHAYLHTSCEKIKNIAIVGANDGAEFDSMEKAYPNACFIMFEPSPKYFPALQERFTNSPKARCVSKACGKQSGTMRFYELPLAGNGSLLRPNPEEWQRFTKWEDSTISEYEVQVTTLDHEISGPLDLLWVDVQGAELQVLEGARTTLSNTKAVFLEVALAKNPYAGGALLHELNGLLENSGHKLVLLGLDPWNFTGNALWVRGVDELVTKE